MRRRLRPFDAKGIYRFGYSVLLAGHFHMRRRYRIRRPAGTEDWLLILTLAGKGIFRYAGGELVTRRGDMVLIRPKTPHDYGLEQSRQYWELLWAHFRPLETWKNLLHWPEVSPGLMRLSIPPTRQGRQITDYFRAMHSLSIGTMLHHHWMATHALEGLLLWSNLINPASGCKEIDPRVARAIEHVEQHLDKTLSTQCLAGISGLSVSRFSWTFRQMMGQTPQQYIECQRMDRARRLLQIEGIGIKEIAASVGFPDPFYFSQRFRRHVGTSPREYRKAFLTR